MSRDGVRLTFLGTSDAFNAAGRAHSAYWIDDPAGAFAVDFGPTTLLRCKALGRDPEALDAVFVTHLHGDHIGGLAILLADQEWRARRRRPLVIGGPPGIAERVRVLRANAYPSLLDRGLKFPLQFVDWRIPGTVPIGPRSVTAIRAVHDRTSVAASLRVETGGRTLAFSGDTAWQPALGELARDADVLVCECTELRAETGGHVSLEDLRAHRAELAARRVVVSHLSAETRAALTREAAALDVTVADDGLVLDI